MKTCGKSGPMMLSALIKYVCNGLRFMGGVVKSLVAISDF